MVCYWPSLTAYISTEISWLPILKCSLAIQAHERNSQPSRWVALNLKCFYLFIHAICKERKWIFFLFHIIHFFFSTSRQLVVVWSDHILILLLFVIKLLAFQAQIQSTWQCWCPKPLDNPSPLYYIQIASGHSQQQAIQPLKSYRIEWLQYFMSKISNKHKKYFYILIKIRNNNDFLKFTEQEDSLLEILAELG